MGEPQAATPEILREGGRLTRWDLLVALGMLLAWAAFFAVEGTAVSAYHLEDDHEIIRITADLRTRSFLEVAGSWVRNDVRFRPVYYTHRVAQARVFGDDFRAWGIYTTALGAATFVLLYATLRWLRFPRLAALAFAFFSLCGEQLGIWWRIGPNETVGMFCLAVACVGLARWSVTGSRLWRALFWLGSVLASLSKESFVAVLPALVLAAAWSLVVERGYTWRTALVACIPDACILGATAVAEALVIVFVYGTERMGYAGVRGITLHRFWVAAIHLLGLPEELTMAGLVVLYLLVARSGRRRALQALAPGLVLATYVIGTQAFVYAKSGLYERYRVPGALAAALLVACLLRGVASAARPAADETSSPAERRRTRHRWAVVVAACAAALVPLGAFRIAPAAAEAARYARDGRATQAFLDAVTRLRAGSRIVVAGGVLGVSEDFWSMHWYLRLRGNDLRVSYLLVQPERKITPFEEQLLVAFPANSFFPKFRPAAGEAPPDAIALLREEERGFLRQSAGWFDPATYARVEFPGAFALYTRHER